MAQASQVLMQASGNWGARPLLPCQSLYISRTLLAKGLSNTPGAEHCTALLNGVDWDVYRRPYLEGVFTRACIRFLQVRLSRVAQCAWHTTKSSRLPQWGSGQHQGCSSSRRQQRPATAAAAATTTAGFSSSGCTPDPQSELAAAGSTCIRQLPACRPRSQQQHATGSAAGWQAPWYLAAGPGRVQQGSFASSGQGWTISITACL